jgi:multidrug efflux system membrane fusion protein
MRITPRSLASALLLAAAAGAAARCSAGGEASAPQRGGGRSAEQPAVPVMVAPVVRKPMPVDIRVIGTAEPYSTVSVHAQITGELTSVNFKEGDEVGKGRVLFTLDRRPLEAALQQAQANLARDQAQATNAAAQAARYQDLLRRGIATREQVDQVTTNAAALQATLGADAAALDNAKVQLQYATVTAPLSGRTGALMVHVGNLVRANDTTPLVVINQIAPIYVSFGVPEAQLSDLKRYMAQGSLRVEAAPPNADGPPSSGRITFVDNAVDQTTGTIRIKGTFGNADRRLWPGQFVNIQVTLTTDAAAIVVPSTAVQAGQQGQYAFVVKRDQTVELRTLTVARGAGDETVIKAGLMPGEIVVTDGHLRLVPGTKVSVKGGSGEKAP